MRVTRNDILAIAKKPYKLVSEDTKGEIDYVKWVNFIETHPQHFIWYENTEEGKEALKNIDKVPQWAKERVLYSLNKRKAHCTSELMPKPTDLVIAFSSSDNRVGISMEKNMTKKVAEVLISMANSLNALLLKNGNEIIDEKFTER